MNLGFRILDDSYIDKDAFVNCKYVPLHEKDVLAGCIIVINKNESATIKSKMIPITIKRFRIAGMGNISKLPDYNYIMKIEILSENDTKLPMYDKNYNSKDFVCYSDNTPLSDEMHLSEPVSNIKIKITIEPKGLDENIEVKKKAHISAYKIIHSENE